MSSDTMLRLSLLEPSELEADQARFYNELTETVQKNYGNRFATKDEQNRFIGPFGIVMHTPAVGRAFYQTASAISALQGLPVRAREIAILTVGSHFGTEYEMYAHERLALDAGVTSLQIDKLKQGSLPEGLAREEGIAYEIANAILKTRGTLNKTLWDEAIGVFGEMGVICLMHLVGFYAYTCCILNGFAARAPTPP